MSTATSPQQSFACLYDEDFYAWAVTTAALLRQRRFAEIDFEHLAEELEGIGKCERRALKSHIRKVILHMLKWRYQPDKRSSSWAVDSQWTNRNSRTLTRQSKPGKPSSLNARRGIYSRASRCN